MIGEVDLYGVLCPPLLIWLGLAFAISMPLRWGLTKLGLYKLVWHAALFDIALLVILLGAISLFMNFIVS